MFRRMLVSIFLFFLLLSSFPFSAWSQSGDEDPEYNFRWLDPNKKIYVIQNRKYKKQGTLELGVGGGLNLSGAYINGYDGYARAAFYVSETMGISFLGLFQTNGENGNLKELKKDNSNILPNIRYIKSMFAGYITFIPFYGKLNLFNRIFYIDWHWEFGVGSVSSEYDLNSDPDRAAVLGTSDHMAFTWGTGMKFFVSRKFVARLDMQALYYSAPIVDGGALSATENKMEYNYLLMFGFGYHF